MKLKHPPRQFTLVIWDDAHGASSGDMTESTIDEWHHPMRYQSYGWLLRSDSKGVMLATEHCVTDATYRAWMFIDRKMVINEIPFTLTKKTERKEKPSDPVRPVSKDDAQPHGS